MASYYGPGSTGASPGFNGQDPMPVMAMGLTQGYGASGGSYGGRAYNAGPLPPQGMAMYDGTVVYGTYMGNGQIQGQVKLPDGRMVSGTFPLDPLGRSIEPGALQQAMAGGGAGPGGGDAGLEEQRRQAFGSLGQGANYFAGPLGRQTEASLMAGQQGLDVPYTQPVQDRLFARQADMNAGQEAGMQDRIRASFNDRGMGGSGGELAATLGAARERGAANTAAETEIANRAQLENFAARERARQASTDFLQSRSASESPYRLKEADLRSRFEVTGQSPLGALGGMLGLGGNLGGSMVSPMRATGGVNQAGAQFRPQSSADAMARGRSGGVLNGTQGFSYVDQQGGAPTVAPSLPGNSSPWQPRPVQSTANTGGWVQQQSYPQGGSPWGAPLDWTKVTQASGAGGMLGNAFRSNYGG